MGLGSGLAAQLMTAEESTYGTIVTPDRAYEFVPPDSVKLDQPRIESQAIRTGQQIQRSDRWAPGKRSVAGSIKMELGNKSFGRWFKHMFGGVATTQPDAAGNPTVYKHSFSLADLPTGQTVQLGRPDVGGTNRPFTYSGCKVDSWTLESQVDQIAKLTVKLLGRDEDTATSLAVASYPTGLTLMTFINGTLTVGGSAQDVKSISLDGNNGLAANRYFMGSALRKNPLLAALRTVTGKAEAEFENLTAYQRYVNGTEAALVLLFQGATISTTYKFEVKITANVRFDGETPNVNDMGIVPLSLPFKVVDSGSSSIVLDYQTTDSLP